MTLLFDLGLILTTWGLVGLLVIPEILRHEELMAKKREGDAWRKYAIPRIRKKLLSQQDAEVEEIVL